jgi:hypothetical protein
MLTTSQDDLMVHTVENSHLKDDRTLTHTITFMDDTDDEFRVFHKLTYETINKWAQMDNKWLQWRKWTFAGLKDILQVQGIKRILNVNDIYKYVTKMEVYHVFVKNFTIRKNASMGLLKYSYFRKSVIHVYRP